MEDCLERTPSPLRRPFLVSDGTNVLIVALPGKPLKVVADDGKLVDATEQDFQQLIRSVWPH